MRGFEPCLDEQAGALLNVFIEQPPSLPTPDVRIPAPDPRDLDLQDTDTATTPTHTPSQTPTPNMDTTTTSTLTPKRMWLSQPPPAKPKKKTC